MIDYAKIITMYGNHNRGKICDNNSTKKWKERNRSILLVGFYILNIKIYMKKYI